jgi:hypothetical protein
MVQYTSRSLLDNTAGAKTIYRLKEDQGLCFRWNWVQEKKLRGIRLQIPHKGPPHRKESKISSVTYVNFKSGGGI